MLDLSDAGLEAIQVRARELGDTYVEALIEALRAERAHSADLKGQLKQATAGWMIVPFDRSPLARYTVKIEERSDEWSANAAENLERLVRELEAAIGEKANAKVRAVLKAAAMSKAMCSIPLDVE